MSTINETVDVVIVGAGPVGLAAAYLLGSYGLRVQVFETRTGYSTHYRGPYLHAATAELHRRWGVFQHTRDREWNFDRVNGVIFSHSIRNEEIAVMRTANTEAEWRALYAKVSPEVPHFLPAGVQEEGLHKQIGQWSGVRVDFGHEVTHLTQDADGVTVQAANVQDRGQVRSVRARLVVAADGARSAVAGLVGAGQELAWDFGPQVFVTFDGDIDQFLSDPRCFQVFITNREALGYFSRRRPDQNFWGYIYPSADEELPTPEQAQARIRTAVGDPAFPLKVVDIGRYRIRSRIIESYRHGRVFFAGDSAHSHSPWGGFGQNLGIPDANNLAWKIAAVLTGQAGDALLDTYEAERKVHALLTIKATAFNDYHYWESMLKAYWELEAHDTHRQAANAYLRLFAPGLLGGWFNHAGLQFGGRYVSSAVVEDGQAGPVPSLSSVSHHVRSGVPGVRAPHLWLVDAQGREVSTVDLFGRSFVLLADGADSGWQQAAEGLGLSGVGAIAVHEIGPRAPYRERDESWRDVYGVQAGGAVLVRPDGHIGARFTTVPVDRRAHLKRVINAILHIN